MEYFPEKEWETLPPEQAGLPSYALCALLDRIESERMNLHGLVLLRGGRIALEQYWGSHGRDSADHVFSITKAVISLLAGVAVGEGLLDEDAPVHAYFPEIRAESLEPNMRKMKVRHLMTMSSGQERDSDWNCENAAARFFATPVPYEPGSRFAYMNGCATMVSAILQRTAGRPLADYAQEKLFAPLDIERPAWDANPDGVYYGGHGICLTTRDIARMGLLLLRLGEWRGGRIVPRDYVERATSALRPSFAEGDPNWTAGYGYFFWRNAPALGGYHGVGLNGHYCVVIPKYDLVCAATAQGEMFRILHALEEALIPNLS